GSDIPAGWALCDGSQGTPDLRSRFIVGVGQGKGLSEYDQNATGGAERITLQKNEMPRHNHYGCVEEDGSHTHEIFGNKHSGHPWHNRNDRVATSDATGGPSIHTQRVGGHKHTIEWDGGSEAHENRPPYHALSFIMKT
ncbi:MAG: hypothetical protein AAFP93_01345, partial [Bacteroidota bacterium]